MFSCVFPHEIDDLGGEFVDPSPSWRVRTLGLLPAFNCKCVAVAPLIAPQAVCPKTMTILSASVHPVTLAPMTSTAHL